MELNYQQYQPTYHHYRSAGTLYYNNHDNELLRSRGGERNSAKPTPMPRFSYNSGSVPNISESVQQQADYHYKTRSESLHRRRSMSSHDMNYKHQHPIYNTIGSANNTSTNSVGYHQPFPKLIQVSELPQQSIILNSLYF